MLIENLNDAEFSTNFNAQSLEPASRFKRWLASVINSVLLWIAMIVGSMGGQAALVLLILGYIALQLYFMKTYGQTIAKQWLGLRVFDFNTQKPVEFAKYVGREAIDLLFTWSSFLLLISGIVALVRDDRRSLTDLLIGTVVMKDEK